MQFNSFRYCCIYICGLFVSLLFLSSCSSKSNVKKNNKPDWINLTEMHCEDGFICSIGEGYSINESFSNARAEIAKQFSVSIKSSFNSALVQKNDSTNSFANLNVKEVVDEMINGIEISKSFYDEEAKLFYSLAILDKDKAASEVKRDINLIDEELKRIVNNKPVNIIKADKLLNKRKNKESKYVFLTGKQIAEKISKNDILKAKSEPTHYKLEIVDEENFGLKDIVSNQIVGNKDVVDDNANKIISGKITLDKSYLRVSGFEKYEIDVVLKCIENKDIKGQIHIKMYETGRTKQQVIDKIKKQVIMQISDSVDKLLV